ncbi:MAG: hypothetical protein ACRC92_07445 [Peptostreptococcaceae bacterium]
MDNIVTFSIMVVVLLASFQLVDSIQIFIQKHKDNPKKILQFGAIRLATIFLAMTSLAYMLGLSSTIINSILILMAVVIALFVLMIKLMYKNNIN